MKFNYELYRPKKVIQDVYTSDKPYYKAKDVQVSPLTKIGDVADMPQPAKQGARKKARMLIRKLTPKFGGNRMSTRAIPVQVADADAEQQLEGGAKHIGAQLAHIFSVPKKYTSRRSLCNGFSLLGFVSPMKYALLGVALLGTGIGFMAVSFHGSAMMNSASGKSSDNAEAAGSGHTTSTHKDKARAAQQQSPPPAAPASPPTPPQDVPPATNNSANSASSMHSRAPSSPNPLPKPSSAPSATIQPAPAAAATPPAIPSPALQPTPIPPSPTPSQPSTPPSDQPSGSAAPTPVLPSAGSTTSPNTSTLNTSTSKTTIITGGNGSP